MKQTDTTITEGETNVAPAAAVENASVKRPRAHYIDLVRGICALSIVFIHTCFHSGGSYVPMPMRSISLLLDVPAFFFIAGMTRAYIQKDTILTQLFKLSMIFVLLGFRCNLVDGEVTWASIFRPLFLMGLNVSRLFGAAAGSYWFVPIYACTIILGGVAIKHTGGGVYYGDYFPYRAYLRTLVRRTTELFRVQLSREQTGDVALPGGELPVWLLVPAAHHSSGGPQTQKICPASGIRGFHCFPSLLFV